MEKNPSADLLDSILKAGPKLPLTISRSSAYEVEVSNVYHADDPTYDDGLVQSRQWGDVTGTSYAWANYVTLAGNALPILLEVVNAALGSNDAKVRSLAREASKKLMGIVDQIDGESTVELDGREGDDW